MPAPMTARAVASALTQMLGRQHSAPMTTAPRSIVFTGHMIDLPDRATPRFPARLEGAAAKAIKAKIAAAKAPGMIGIASGARGGDILFHEAARGLGLVTMIVLPFSPKAFAATSLGSLAGVDWTGRFHTLWNATREDDRLMMGLPEADESFATCNNKLIELAAARGPYHLIALWDGKESGLPGGTDDLVRKAKAQSANVDIIAPQHLEASR